MNLFIGRCARCHRQMLTSKHGNTCTDCYDIEAAWDNTITNGGGLNDPGPDPEAQLSAALKRLSDAYAQYNALVDATRCGGCGEPYRTCDCVDEHGNGRCVTCDIGNFGIGTTGHCEDCWKRIQKGEIL